MTFTGLLGTSLSRLGAVELGSVAQVGPASRPATVRELTATPGTIGALVPGYHATGLAVYQGPDRALVSIYPNVTQRGIADGDTIAVTTVVASQLALSDAGWWQLL